MRQGPFDLLVQAAAVQGRDGMGQDDKGIVGHALGPRHDLGGVDEGIGADDSRGDAPALQVGPGVHTARATGASIAYGCEDDVAPGGDLVQDDTRGHHGKGPLGPGGDAGDAVVMLELLR